jgi:hypothetical protein
MGLQFVYSSFCIGNNSIYIFIQCSYLGESDKLTSVSDKRSGYLELNHSAIISNFEDVNSLISLSSALSVNLQEGHTFCGTTVIILWLSVLQVFPSHHS